MQGISPHDSDKAIHPVAELGRMKGRKMSRIGFIGLGVMGKPMAANLHAAGHEVLCHSRSKTTRAIANERGLKTVSAIAEAVDGAEVIISIVPDTPDVLDVMHGSGGVFASASPPAIIIDMSTIDPGATRVLHAEAESHGLRYVDAPVSGGERGAIEGTLSIMAGGSDADVEKVRPILDLLGSTVVRVGPAGAGQTVKAANQLIVAGNIQVLAEALMLLRKHRADLPKALEVLGGGLAGSTVLDRKGELMLAGDFAPGFRLELHDKDLKIALAAARDVGAVVPVAAVVAQLVAAMVARGDGGLDHGGLYRLVESLNGES